MASSGARCPRLDTIAFYSRVIFAYIYRIVKCKFVPATQNIYFTVWEGKFVFFFLLQYKSRQALGMCWLEPVQKPFFLQLFKWDILVILFTFHREVITLHVRIYSHDNPQLYKQIADICFYFSLVSKIHYFFLQLHWLLLILCISAT